MIDLFYPPQPPEPRNARLVININMRAKVEGAYSEKRKAAERTPRKYCRNGHLMDDENTLIKYERGSIIRKCWACRHAAEKRRKRRKL